MCLYFNSLRSPDISKEKKTRNVEICRAYIVFEYDLSGGKNRKNIPEIFYFKL